MINTETSLEGDFAKIGTEVGTDKIYKHRYNRFYPRYIEKYRNMDNFALLEIGIDDGHSLKLWNNYFPKAYIYGIDINKEYNGDNYKIMKADQSDLIQLRSLNINHKISFIIDDGSHIPEHQLLSFNHFFENILQPGGCYIIEDIETSYWTKNGLYGYETRYHEKSIIEIFKYLIDDINKLFLTENSKSEQNTIQSNKFSQYIRNNISTITFGENCIIILKKTEEEMLYSREYNHTECL
jgi:hypothetical protein